MDDLQSENKVFMQNATQNLYKHRAKQYKLLFSVFGASLVGYSTYYIAKKGHVPIVGYAAFLMGAFSLYINDSLSILSKNPIKL